MFIVDFSFLSKEYNQTVCAGPFLVYSNAKKKVNNVEIFSCHLESLEFFKENISEEALNHTINNEKLILFFTWMIEEHKLNEKYILVSLQTNENGLALQLFLSLLTHNNILIGGIRKHENKEFEDLNVVIDYAQYSNKIKHIFTFTSRGCPYSCEFCFNKNEPVAFRDATIVTNEIFYYYNKFNIKNFTITDTSFDLNEDNLLKICKLITLSECKIYFSYVHVNVKTRLLDEDFKTLYQAGFKKIAIGLETFDDASRINYLQKNFSLTNFIELLERIKDFKIKLYFMVGVPGDTDYSEELNELLIQYKNITAVKFTTYCKIDSGDYNYSWEEGNNNQVYRKNLKEKYKNILRSHNFSEGNIMHRKPIKKS